MDSPGGDEDTELHCGRCRGGRDGKLHSRGPTGAAAKRLSRATCPPCALCQRPPLNQSPDARQLEDRIDELRLEESKAVRRNDTAEAARVGARRIEALEALDSLGAEAAAARVALFDPVLMQLFPEVARSGALSAGQDSITTEPSAGTSWAGLNSVLLEGVRRSHFELGEEVASGVGWRTLAVHPVGQAAGAALPSLVDGELALTELQMGRSVTFESTHAKLAALHSPLLPPCSIFFDADIPPITFAISTAPRAPSLRGWLSATRAAGVGTARDVLGDLSVRMAPVLSALATLHRLGISHGSLAPEAVITDGDGRVLYLSRIGFPNAAAGGGPYVSPELLHDPAAALLWPLAADAWAVGVMMVEALSGETPRWNAQMRRLEASTSGQPLEPPPGPRPECALAPSPQYCLPARTMRTSQRRAARRSCLVPHLPRV